MSKLRINIVCLILTLGFCVNIGLGQIEEFDLKDSKIDPSQLLGGGPAKDGIPAINEPKFIPAQEVDFLSSHDLVVGIIREKEARAYPLKVLNWHEIVNDRIKDQDISVTWCPLTRSAIIFNPILNKQKLIFGVSGLLFNNNLVMYDKNTSSLWPQLSLKAVSGEFSGTNLELIPSLVTTWQEWRSKYPHTLVLSSETGWFRNYEHDPYAEYQNSPEVMFSLNAPDKRLPAKSLVLGVKINDQAKAYLISEIQKLSEPLRDTVGGVNIWVHKGPVDTAYITDGKDKLISAIRMYWFAWSTFNPGSEIFPKLEKNESKQ